MRIENSDVIFKEQDKDSREMVTADEERVSIQGD